MIISDQENTVAESSAILQLEASNKGLLIPRIASVDSIPSPTNGLMVYIEGENSYYYYKDSLWTELGGSEWERQNDKVSYHSENDTSSVVSQGIYPDYYASINTNKLYDTSLNLYSGLRYTSLKTTAYGGVQLESSPGDFYLKGMSAIKPYYNGQVSLGTPSRRFKDLYLTWHSDLYIDQLSNPKPFHIYTGLTRDTYASPLFSMVVKSPITYTHPNVGYFAVKNNDTDLNTMYMFSVQSGGRVGIGTGSPEGALDVKSSTGGVIVPRLTKAEILTLPLIEGTVVYCTDYSTDPQFLYCEKEGGVVKWVLKASSPATLN